MHFTGSFYKAAIVITLSVLVVCLGYLLYMYFAAWDRFEDILLEITSALAMCLTRLNIYYNKT